MSRLQILFRGLRLAFFVAVASVFEAFDHDAGGDAAGPIAKFDVGKEFGFDTDEGTGRKS